MINIRKKYKQRNFTYIKTNISINQSKNMTQRCQHLKDNYTSHNISCLANTHHQVKDQENTFLRYLSTSQPKQRDKPMSIANKSLINLNNIKKLSKMTLKVVQNVCKNMPPEINTDDYQVERVRILDLFRTGNFGKVYTGILTSSTSMEVVVKKIPIDSAHKSREQYFAGILNSPYVVQFKGTYHTQQFVKSDKTNEVNPPPPLFEKNQTKSKTQIKSSSHQEVPIKFLNIVMKKYGNNLSQILQLQKLDPVRIKIYLYQMIRAVAYIHSLNICHRDIKPHNFVVKNNRIFLCDFGAAKRMRSNEENSSSATYVFQREYRAPQLLFGYQNYGKQVDIWALGCVMGEILIKKQLFRGSNNLDQLIKVLRVIGTPKWTTISFCKDRMPKIPDIEGTGLKQILGPESDIMLVKLIKKMLVIQPTERITALQALCDPYFDEIREQNFYRAHLRSTNLPNFFYFTKRQTFGKEQYVHKLIPFWIKQHCKRFSIKIQDYNF